MQLDNAILFGFLAPPLDRRHFFVELAPRFGRVDQRQMDRPEPVQDRMQQFIRRRIVIVLTS